MVLALPMAKVLKDHFPGTKIYFLGRRYTKPVVNACIYADGFIELEDFLKNKITIDEHPIHAIVHAKPFASVAKRAMQLHVPWRIGTTHRAYHWIFCNKLINLSRKHSDLHEAQLNLKLLTPFGIKKEFSLEEISESYGLTKPEPLREEFASLIDKTKYNLILHPKSRGSAREWGLQNFISLVMQLDLDRYKIFISGTASEKNLVQPLLDEIPHLVTDITGIMDLGQFISFISACDGLIACSTGPLHLAAALGKHAMGIYVPLRPIHAGRWGPVGEKSEVFVVDRSCTNCAKNAKLCQCISEVEPAWIKASLDRQLNALQKTEQENANKSV
jgi:ADP-heptose:LPS heptosyltransferase